MFEINTSATHAASWVMTESLTWGFVSRYSRIHATIFMESLNDQTVELAVAVMLRRALAKKKETFGERPGVWSCLWHSGMFSGLVLKALRQASPSSVYLPFSKKSCTRSRRVMTQG